MKRWNKLLYRGLAFKITATAVLYAVVITSVFAIIMQYSEYQRQGHELIASTKDKLTLFAESLAAPVWSFQEARVDELLKGLETDKRIVSVEVVDELGVTVSTLQLKDIEPNGIYRTELPIIYDGRDVGRIIAEISQIDIQRDFQRNIIESIVSIIILLTVLSIVLWFSMSRIACRIKIVSNAFKDLTSGDLDTELHVKRSHDEIGTLASAFDFAKESLISRRQVEIRTKFLAERDPLTGLFNRNQLQQQCNDRISQATELNPYIVLLLIDLDHFKDTNDTLGHSFGDELLKNIAQRMNQSTREVDITARLGGDEFVIVLNDIANKDSIEGMVSRIQTNLLRPYSIGDQVSHSTVSIGFSIFPEHGTNFDDLMRHADLALYSAKKNRGTMQVYGHQLAEEKKRLQDVEMAIHESIECNLFALALQPQIDTVNGELIGAEALLRLDHPTLGYVSPLEIVEVAERCNIIQDIGRWVTRNACQKMLCLTQQGIELPRLAINVSPNELLNEHFLRDFFDEVERAGCAPDKLEIEITESVLLREPDTVIKKLETLKHAGVKIAIDDFGAGYSSLAYLKNVPADKLKIDRSFVRDLPHDNSDAILIKAMVGLSKSFGLAVLAEGVENQAQEDFLKAHDCRLVQGYHIAKPLPSIEFGAWAQEHQHRRALGRKEHSEAH